MRRGEEGDAAVAEAAAALDEAGGVREGEDQHGGAGGAHPPTNQTPQPLMDQPVLVMQRDGFSLVG